MKPNMSESDHHNGKGTFNLQTGALFLSLIAPAALLILTICTTTMSGFLVSGSKDIVLTSIWKAIPCALGVLPILGTHALGHYIQVRLLGVRAYPPYL